MQAQRREYFKTRKKAECQRREREREKRESAGNLCRKREEWMTRKQGKESSTNRRKKRIKINDKYCTENRKDQWQVITTSVSYQL